MGEAVVTWIAGFGEGGVEAVVTRMASLGERGGRNKDSQPQQRKGPEGTRKGRGGDRSRDGTGVTQICTKRAQTGPEGAEERGRTGPEGAEKGRTGPERA